MTIDESRRGGRKRPPPSPVVVDDSSSSSSSSSTTSSPAVVRPRSLPDGGGRLFAPFRTVGVATSGRGFSVDPPEAGGRHGFLAVPAGDRFRVLRTDRLTPSLASDALPGGAEVRRVVADASLEVAVAIYRADVAAADDDDQRQRQRQGRWRAAHYRRTAVTGTIALRGDVVDVIRLGRTKATPPGETEPRTCATVAVLCRFRGRSELDDDDDDDDDDEGATVAVVGEDSDEEEDEDDVDPAGGDGGGELVVLLAFRDALFVRDRVPVPVVRPSRVAHPSTYVNKVVVGGAGGRAALLNVRTSKVVHEFRCLLPRTRKDSSSYDVTALEQSPAVDVVAVGDRGGRARLVNLRTDTLLFALEHGGGGDGVSVTALSFRSDVAAAAAPRLAVGRSDGALSVWDLTERTLVENVVDAHRGGVAAAAFLVGEPVLVTAGGRDNAIVARVFDAPDGSSRVLRERRGSAAPPTALRWARAVDDDGAFAADAADAEHRDLIVADAAGEVRRLAVAREDRDRELAQGRGSRENAAALGVDRSDLLLPPVIAVAACAARRRDWGDLVTIHENHAFAYAWSTTRGAQCGPVLREDGWSVSARKQAPAEEHHATSVALSACGHFCLVGRRGGVVHKYNVQSGLPRGSYPRREDVPSERKKYDRVAGSVARSHRLLAAGKTDPRADLDARDAERAAARDAAKRRRLADDPALRPRHENAAVAGLAVDDRNRELLTAGADGKLIFWDFLRRAPRVLRGGRSAVLLLPSPATRLRPFRDGDLVAVGTADGDVRVIDREARTVVRRLRADPSSSSPSSSSVTDLAWDPDGRRLLASDSSKRLSVWDVPTGTRADWMEFDKAPTCAALDATGEFLATAHEGETGVRLWCDRSFFSTVEWRGTGPDRPYLMTRPTPKDEEESDDDDESDESEDDETTTKGRTEEEEEETMDPATNYRTVLPKEKGLVTLSGLPPSQWRSLFHLELVRERNKPKEPPKKPPSAPFFLQWQGGRPPTTNNDQGKESTDAKQTNDEKNNDNNNDDEWEAAWSDDDDNDDSGEKGGTKVTEADRATPIDSSSDDVHNKDSRSSSTDNVDLALSPAPAVDAAIAPSRGARSHLAALLERCSSAPAPHRRDDDSSSRYDEVTAYAVTLGPSAVDAAIASLCRGPHDAREGLPSLRAAAEWLTAAHASRKQREVVHAWTRRFLRAHADVVAGLDDEPDEEDETERAALLAAAAKLRRAAREGDERLREPTRRALCALRHFSRIV